MSSVTADAIPVQVRWQDLDALGHVGHGAALALLEEGRDAFLAERGIPREQYVVGRCTVTYRAEIDAAVGEVWAECAIRELGRSSLRTAERIAGADGETLIEAEFQLVLWNPQTRSARPIEARERAILRGPGVIEGRP